MKKNIDPQTAKLFEAVKKEYFFQYSDILKSETCANVTVDQIIALLSGKWIDGLTFAEGVVVPYCYKTDMKVAGKTVELRCGLLGSVVRLINGYTCSVESLPRIYKQLARLAGEKVETIAVGPRPMLAYGLTDAALKDKKNKKMLAMLKKYCVADDMRIFPGYVFHDDRRRCAVWSDGHILLVSPALYNPEAAGQMYDKNGQPVKGDNYKFPNYPAVVPDYNNCFSFDAATVARNMASVLPFVPKSKYSTPTMIIANVDGVAAGVNPNFKPVFDCMPGRVYTTGHATPYIAPLGDSAADGFILVMPMYTEADGPIKNVLYEDIEAEIKVCGVVPDAEADSLPAILPPVVDGAADIAPVAETPAADAADVVETPAPAAAPCVALVVVPVADAEPQQEPAAAPVRDAADIEAELTAAVIRCHYSSMMAQAEPLPVVDTYDMETLSDNAAIIRCRRRGASVLVAVDGDSKLNNYSYTATCIETGKFIGPGRRGFSTGGYTQIEAMQAGIHSAIKNIIEYMPIVADAEPAAEPAAEPVPMLPDPPAVVHISGPVPPSPRRRRQSPRLRPIFRRLWRVAAVVVPLVVLAMLTASTAADNGHQTPAANAVAMTPAAALPVAVDADTLQVVELPPVTVTAPSTPSGQKIDLTPSGQKTAAAVADASHTDEPTADTPAGQKTDADGLPDTLQPDSQPHGLTICEGTAWAYTMMNWA